MREFFECHNHLVAPRKERTITIKLDNVYSEIDRWTYKYVEASSIESPKTRNAMSSDSTESLDKNLLARNVEMRDAALRGVIRFVLADTAEVASADDDLSTATSIVYNLLLPLSFKDALLKSLTTYIHRYLAWGALYDWYAAGMDSAHAKVFANELSDLEATITNLLHSDEIVKMPMQPFGPAIKII